MAGGHRLHCIYSTERQGAADEQPSLGPGARALHTGNGEVITPGEYLRTVGDPPPSDRMEDHYRRAERQMPVLLGAYEGERVTFVVDADADADDHDIAADALRLSAFRLPYGGLVLCLTLQLNGDLAVVVDVLQRTCWQWQSMRIDGLTLEQCAARIPEMAPELGSVVLGTDVHHLLAVDPEQVPVLTDGGSDGGSPTSGGHPSDVDPDTVAALIFRTQEPVRSAYADVRYPKAANRREGTVVAVGAYVVVVSSFNRELEGWVLWSVLQLTCAQARLRQVRADVYNLLYGTERGVAGEVPTSTPTQGRIGDVRAAHAAARADLAELSHCLGRLEQELAFGVAAYVDTHAVLPSPMLTHTHRALTEQMELASGIESASELLARATRNADARHAALGALERSVDKARQRRLDGVVAAMTAVALLMAVFFGFFGSNASPISEDHRPFLHADYAWFYAALVGMAGATYLLIVAALRRVPPRDLTDAD